MYIFIHACIYAFRHLCICLYQYGLLDIYFILEVIIRCYGTYLVVQVVSALTTGSSFNWPLYRIDVFHITVSFLAWFLEHFPTLWFCKMPRAYLVVLPPHPTIGHVPEQQFLSLKNGADADIWVQDMLIGAGTSSLLGPLSPQSKGVCLLILTIYM